MRVFIFIILGLGCQYAQGQDDFLVTQSSYYIDAQQDTFFGLVKLGRNSESFYFLANNEWKSSKKMATEVTQICKEGDMYMPMSYNNKIRLLRVIGQVKDSIFLFQKKKERFYVKSKVPPKQFNFLAPYYARDNMNKRYVVFRNNQAYTLTRFNYHNQMAIIYKLSAEQIENCKFQEFGLDVGKLLME